jgi:hypothetical protein
MLLPTAIRPDCLDFSRPPGAHDHSLITLTVADLLMLGASLTRERVCSLLLLLGIASAAILGSESRRIHGHILFETSTNLGGGKVAVCISPQTKWPRCTPRHRFSSTPTPLHSSHLSLFILHPPNPCQSQSQVMADAQSVSMSECGAPSGSHD